MPAFLDENARHIRGNTETDVDGIAVAQLLRNTPRNHFSDIELRDLE